MNQGPRRRPKRVPFTQEEVDTIITYKQRKKDLQLLRFKRTWQYKALNLFNIACFFIYVEVVCCFLEPANFEAHYAYNILPHHGDKISKAGKPIVDEIEIHACDGRQYVFVVRDFIEIPDKDKKFYVSRDFLLGKRLTGKFEPEGRSYRLFAASSVLFFSMFIIVISIVAFIYDLNENPHSLNGLTIVNGLTLMAIAFF